MIRLEMGESGKRGTWWPARPGQTCAFYFCCPQCGSDMAAFLSRVVRDDGQVETAVICRCKWSAELMLVGWNTEKHMAQVPDHRDASRREMRHICGQVIELSPRTALYFALDPRILRGHWCPACKRHGWNHEWVWTADGKMVGEGWIGTIRYSDLLKKPPEERAIYETHALIPDGVRG